VIAPRLCTVLSGLLLACADEHTPARADLEVAHERPAESPVKPEPERLPDPALVRATAAATMLDTVDALGELHRRHAADCPALAQAVTAFHARHAVALAEVPPDVLAHIDADEALRVRMRAAMELVMSASMACRDDPAFAAAGTALFGAEPM
jgi:hypothetical protein